MLGDGRPHGLRRGSNEGACELKGGKRDRCRRDHCQSKLVEAPAPDGPQAAWTLGDVVPASLAGCLPT